MYNVHMYISLLYQEAIKCLVIIFVAVEFINSRFISIFDDFVVEINLEEGCRLDQIVLS